MKKIVLKGIVVTAVILISLAANSQVVHETEVFEKRREKVFDLIGDNSIAIFPGAVRNEFGQTDDVLAKYFYYLTGFEDPGAWLILNPSAKDRYNLFVRPFNPGQLVWTGKMPGTEGALEIYNADAALPVNRLEEEFKGMMEGIDRIYFIADNRWLNKMIDQLLPEESTVERVNLKNDMDLLRSVKDSYEIDMTRRAVEITAEAQKEVLKMIRPGINECEVEATIEYVFRKRGSTQPAFTSIVSQNSKIL